MHEVNEILYNEDNMKKGRFIVIEGTDGSGKTTQFEKLVLRMEKPVALFDFPQYNEPSSFFVKEYLAGHYGAIEDVGPYKASLFYALDRFDVGSKINKALNERKFVIANRYVGSNMGHQGAQINDKKERLKYFNWNYDLEYNILGIPKPDINIILHMPAEMAQKMVDKKSQSMRQYVGGKKRDLLESDLQHLKRAEETYLEMSKLFSDNFIVVECVENGKLLSIDEIHEKVWKIVEKIIKE